MRHGDGPPLVLDCGTGARALGFKLVGQPVREMDLLFSHFHMDHVFGFPFFIPIYTPGYNVRISIPAFSEDEARQKLGRYLNGVYHPTRLRELPANVEFIPIRPGKAYRRGVFDVKGLQLNHPGGSVGYRIEADGQSFAYITDTAPFARPGEGVDAGEPPTAAESRVIEFLRDCDMVVYDTMFDHDEYLEKMTWGHSYPEYADALCRAAGVKTLVLFHHLPDASDEMMDALEAKWAGASNPAVIVAREGATVEVQQPAVPSGQQGEARAPVNVEG
ncbi:MAG: MBL fold metallo-hydrolase [Alphaproteobacteria bacterium]|nr:MBL fold metallo-hydrolase [Alphaproteobacteria bacterium]